MEKFKIEIKEILAQVLEIEAESIDDALGIVKQMYKNEEIILSSDQCVDVIIQEIDND